MGSHQVTMFVQNPDARGALRIWVEALLTLDESELPLNLFNTSSDSSTRIETSVVYMLS